MSFELKMVKRCIFKRQINRAVQQFQEYIKMCTYFMSPLSPFVEHLCAYYNLIPFAYYATHQNHLLLYL